MNLKNMIAALVLAPVLSACGGGGDTVNSDRGVLAAGQSVTLASGQTVKAPPGTTVKDASNNVITISGHGSTVNTTAGALVSAPAATTEVADNVVVAK